MTTCHPMPRLRSAMSLVEVAIAVGIVSFCLVSIMGLFPSMLSHVRESREKSLAQRMYQTATEDLHENPVSAGGSRKYSFDSEGFLLGIEPVRDGQTFRAGTTRFTGYATNNSSAVLLTNFVNDAVVLSQFRLYDTVRGSFFLERPIWTTYQ